MTHRIDLDYRPKEIAIRCPRCKNLALFKAAFHGGSFLEEAQSEQMKYPGSDIKPSGYQKDLFVLEYFPKIRTWIPPEKNLRYDYQHSGRRIGEDQGVCVCVTCKNTYQHDLSWPNDAYYSCEISGKLLWAFDRAGMEEIRKFIISKLRDAYPPRVALHVPTHFLIAKNRDLAIKKIDRLLGNPSEH